MRTVLTKVAYDIGVVAAARGFEGRTQEAVLFLVVGACAAGVIAYAQGRGVG